MNVQLKQRHFDDDAINRFLNDKLSTDESRDLESHFSTCAQCASRMTSLAARPWGWEDVSKSLVDDDFDNPIAPVRDGSHDGREDDDTLLRREISGWLDPTDDPEMLGRFAGYEIAGVVGHGGMGIVLKGFERSLNRYVAIKVLAPRLASNAAARKRFEREARAAAAVLHDNVIAIHRVDSWHGLPFLAMPYVAGESLQQRIDREGPLDVEAILRISQQIAAGLAAAHAQGLVHRDIKPANILLDQGVERVTITDFGLARAADDARITRTGFVTGTPLFMSPEQAAATAIDQRSDLFSLGSVMYTMATGCSPFDADENLSVLQKIREQTTRDVRELQENVPDWLAELIDWCHAKSPEERPQSAEKIERYLGEWLAHLKQPQRVAQPIRLVIPQMAQRNSPPPTRWRRKLIAGFGGVLFVLAAILITIETSKGAITIESDTDNVPIVIRKGGEVYDKLTVNRDGRSIRVHAGEYEIAIDGDIDQFAIDDRTIDLKRGKESVARIRQVRAGNAGIHAGKPPLRKMRMAVNTNRIATTDHRIARFTVGNPDIAKAIALAPDEVLVSALSTGTTQIKLWGEDELICTIEIDVLGDSSQLDFLNRLDSPSDKLHVRSVVDAYIKAAIENDTEKAASLASMHIHSVDDGIRNWGEVWKPQRPRVDQQWIGVTKGSAVVVTRPATRVWFKDQEPMTRVVAFFVVSNYGEWTIHEIDLWAVEDVERMRDRFLCDNGFGGFTPAGEALRKTWSYTKPQATVAMSPPSTQSKFFGYWELTRAASKDATGQDAAPKILHFAADSKLNAWANTEAHANQFQYQFLRDGKFVEWKSMEAEKPTRCGLDGPDRMWWAVEAGTDLRYDRMKSAFAFWLQKYKLLNLITDRGIKTVSIHESLDEQGYVDFQEILKGQVKEGTMIRYSHAANSPNVVGYAEVNLRPDAVAGSDPAELVQQQLGRFYEESDQRYQEKSHESLFGTWEYSIDNLVVPTEKGFPPAPAPRTEDAGSSVVGIPNATISMPSPELSIFSHHLRVDLQSNDRCEMELLVSNHTDKTYGYMSVECKWRQHGRLLVLEFLVGNQPFQYEFFIERIDTNGITVTGFKESAEIFRRGRGTLVKAIKPSSTLKIPDGYELMEAGTVLGSQPKEPAAADNM